MSETNTYYCSFVGNHYIVCECGDTYPNEAELLKHLETDIHKHTTTITEYKCGECFKVYATEQECMDHQLIEHPLVKQEHSDKEEVTVKQETYIKKEPSYNDDVQNYIEQELPYNDDAHKYIEYEYVEQKYEDDDYVLPELVPEKPFTIQMTPRGRKQTVHVTEGVRKKKNYVHKNVVCEVCGKKYASAAALRYHQRVHTGVRPYQCSYCPKNFTMGLFLQIHTRTHTGERPYQCTQCPKAFSNKAALLRHDRVHTGAKPYECPKCGKTFTQSNSMKLHVHTVHLKMPAPYKSKRRKAESLAREIRAKKTKRGVEMDQINIIEPKSGSDNTGDSKYTVLGSEGGEVYYCSLPSREQVQYELLPAKEGSVAYELIYEQKPWSENST